MKRKGRTLSFSMRKPCTQCPFRGDCLPGWLGRKRVQQLVKEVVTQERTFSCHETLGKHEQQCVGAVIFTEHLGRAHALLQIAERFGLLKPDRIDRDAAEIFATAEAMEQHHAWE